MAVLLISTMAGGCTTIHGGEGSDRDISFSDASKLHPLSTLTERFHTFSFDESKSANQLYGSPIVSPGDQISYIQAAKRRGQGENGNIFLIQKDDASGPMRILVCVLSGRVHDLLLEGQRSVQSKVLSRFVGRSLEDFPQIARGPSDQTSIPTENKAMLNAPGRSEAIADAVKRALIFAEILKL